jgi:hypothetical protein
MPQQGSQNRLTCTTWLQKKAVFAIPCASRTYVAWKRIVLGMPWSHSHSNACNSVIATGTPSDTTSHSSYMHCEACIACQNLSMRFRLCLCISFVFSEARNHSLPKTSLYTRSSATAVVSCVLSLCSITSTVTKTEGHYAPMHRCHVP